MMLSTVVVTSLVCFSVFANGYIVNPGPKYVATKGAVWPQPQNQIISDDFYIVTPRNFKFNVKGASCTLLTNAFERYFKILQQNTLPITGKKYKKPLLLSEGQYLGTLHQLEVNLIDSCDENEWPTLDMNETYVLNILEGAASLTSESIWGILRGLETFSQLLYLGVDGLSIRINATSITDFPRFKHRGLLLDTARHFIPIKQIKQVIDGLAYNKMNVFHWHLVDDQSFPFVSTTFPELSEEGAYDPELYVYNPTDVQDIIEYARQRGIRVMPEIDTPGHTRSWGVSHPELLTKCDGVVQGSYGPIDPIKNTTYTFLQKLLTEVRSVFKDKFIHLGGDEVDFDCWQLDTDINSFMNDHNISSYAALEGYYIQKIIDMADNLNFSSVVWEEVFKNGVKLPNNTLVHVWRDWQGSWWNDTMNDVTKAGNTALLSACWYLDHLSTGGDWESFYQCEPTDFSGSEEQTKLLLGGEACMWAEVVNEYNVVQRVWPRASATAEKLWSSKDTTNFNTDEEQIRKRLEEHVCRMNRRGIPAQPPNAAGFCL
ncbi:beta-hexosaminidase subunit alpha-like [Anthonomus grandis grandis]|uniref:beta-hexosaminidase subunit alpha-like n=1 Tax=Anthonomus grandis grandis TaxID=2921223 RepID=UPI0021655DAE|nr:beta-hexosaminidase subunit alpha-like [Anthonomus grandis grandis]